MQPGRDDHRAPKGTFEERYGPRHRVRLAPGGMLARLLGTAEIQVNSLHWQGIDRMAEDLVAEGWALDGTIEAVHVKNARTFALGVQWHPEYRAVENPISAALFRAFGDACRVFAQARLGQATGRAA
jgi:putative glutamine amidotransferase